MHLLQLTLVKMNQQQIKNHYLIIMGTCIFLLQSVPQLITVIIDVAHPRQIIYASFVMERLRRRNTTGPTPPSPVEKQNVNVSIRFSRLFWCLSGTF